MLTPRTNEAAKRAVLEVLSPEQFHQAILSLRPRTAVFDCDGTLWNGDTGFDFMVWTLESGMVSREVADWIDDRYRLYRKGELSEVAICGEMVQMYAGLEEQELRSAARVFFAQRFESRIFPAMLALTQSLQRMGTELWAVSSTNRWIVEEGAARFGISPAHVLAATAAIVNGRISSELIDVPTGEGKAQSLVRAGLPHPDLVCGNSVHDAAMLSLGKHAVAIHPTAELLLLAEQKGWTVHAPAPAT